MAWGRGEQACLAGLLLAGRGFERFSPILGAFVGCEGTWLLYSPAEFKAQFHI
jgi:hypothetical protein